MSDALPAVSAHIDSTEAIEALRARGAARFDPVGFHFIEALARRTTARREEAAGMLERRLASALAAFGERFDRARTDNIAMLARATTKHPEAADALKQCCDAGDFGELQRAIGRLEAQDGRSPLVELLAHIGRNTPDRSNPDTDQRGATAGPPRGGLKALAYFRNTWSRLNVDRQLSRSFAQAPPNAGPLNSEFLLLQALKTMRDISPEYLRQFMTYADTLLWLDQIESGRAAARKSSGREKARKQGKDKA